MSHLKIFCAISTIVLLFAIAASAVEPKHAALMTPFAKDIDFNSPLPDYPRPQLMRTDWQSLNGEWQYQPRQESDTAPIGKKLSSAINVPFPVESALSGVMEHHDRLWYRRMFTVPGGRACDDPHGNLQLYNLASDLGETRDLLKDNPDKAKELKTRLDEWMKGFAPVAAVPRVWISTPSKK